MLKIEKEIYEKALELKDLVIKLSEEEAFHDYLIDRDFPEFIAYIEKLKTKDVLEEYWEDVMYEILTLSVQDMNDTKFSREYLYEQGSEYFPQYRFLIPATKDVIAIIEDEIVWFFAD